MPEFPPPDTAHLGENEKAVGRTLYTRDGDFRRFLLLDVRDQFTA